MVVSQDQNKYKLELMTQKKYMYKLCPKDILINSSNTSTTIILTKGVDGLAKSEDLRSPWNSSPTLHILFVLQNGFELTQQTGDIHTLPNLAFFTSHARTN